MAAAVRYGVEEGGRVTTCVSGTTWGGISSPRGAPTAFKSVNFSAEHDIIRLTIAGQ